MRLTTSNGFHVSLVLRLITLLLPMCIALAQSDLDSVIVNAPGPETYPQASVVILRDTERIKLLPSGQVLRHHEFLCKMLSERAYSPFEDQSARFDADEDTVIVETARVRLPDGTWIEAEKDPSTRTLPAGTAIHFAYRIEPKPGVLPTSKRHAGGNVLFGGYEPCLVKQFTIEVSPSWKIRYDLQNGAPEPLVSDGEGGKIYEWTMRDCPQILYESGAVGLPDLVPNVLWTSFSDWEDLGVYVADPFWDKVDSSQAAVDGFLQITSPELQGVPALMNAANWVQRNIRTVGSPSASMDYVPKSADRVWKNRSGDPFDKAVLLTALLRVYGFSPMPVLVPYSPDPFSNLPLLEQFHHIILSVPAGDDTMWLDPAADFYPPGTLPYACTYGKGCMLLAGTPLLTDVPAGSPESRGARTEMRLRLADNGTLSGTVICVPKGDLAAEARRLFKDQNAQERDDYAQAAASRIKPGSTVTSFSVSDPGDLSKPVTVTLGFESPDYTERQEETMLLPLPANPFRFALTEFSATLPEVRYPVQLPPRRRMTTEVSVSIPDDFKVSFLPPPMVVQNPYVFIEITAREAPAGIRWTTTVEIKGDKVPVAGYPLLRAAYETLLLPKNNLVILEMK